MSKEKQILQYWGDGRSQRQTAASLGVSRNTVSPWEFRATPFHR